jgi:hypothetical protein
VEENELVLAVFTEIFGFAGVKLKKRGIIQLDVLKSECCITVVSVTSSSKSEKHRFSSPTITEFVLSSISLDVL